MKESLGINGNLNLSRSIGDLLYKQNDQLPAQEQVIVCNPDVRVEARQVRPNALDLQDLAIHGPSEETHFHPFPLISPCKDPPSVA